MILTYQKLQKITMCGTINSFQAEVLGIPFPRQRGWMTKLVGKEISSEDYLKLYNLKGYTKDKRKNKQINPSEKMRYLMSKMSIEDQIKAMELLGEIKYIIKKYESV